MNPFIHLRQLRITLLAALVIVFPLAAGLRSAHAEEPPNVRMTADDLESFFDARVPDELKRGEVAGAAVAVVRDGKILFVRGYGLADVARGIPVSGTETLFRIASLSKVFTYTAVMQLVEQGKIELDGDIATYLDFPVPDAFGQAITMRHLMTHTAGFDDTIEDRWITSGSPASLRDYLVGHMPRRLYRPGSTPAYSSYGTALAAHIVERVSGEAFDKYIDGNILKRLGMRNTSFEQPLPKYLDDKASKNYMSVREAARPFEITRISPSAGASSTSADMAIFMLAHMSSGEHANKLLGFDARSRMHTVSYRHHPSAPGLALGMYEIEEGSMRVLGHHGDTPLSHSAMYFFADGRTGLFVVQNSGAHAIRNSLLKQFGQRYFRSQSNLIEPMDRASGKSGLVGSYLSTWSFASSPLYMSNLLTNQTVVRQAQGESLVIGPTHRKDGQAITWKLIAENVWQSDDGSARRVFFRRNLYGNWEMGHSRNPVFVEKKLPWYQHPQIIITTMIIALVVLCLHMLWWAATSLVCRRTGKAPSGTGLGKAVNKVNVLASVLALAPWLLYGATAVVVLNDNLLVSTPAFGMALRCIQGLAWAAVGAIGLYLWSACQLRAMPSGWGYRAWQAALVLAALGLSAVAAQGNLLLWDGRW
jgi:CubicO group peptidase (beta-lactamase class C family)